MLYEVITLIQQGYSSSIGSKPKYPRLAFVYAADFMGSQITVLHGKMVVQGVGTGSTRGIMVHIDAIGGSNPQFAKIINAHAGGNYSIQFGNPIPVSCSICVG